MIKKCGIGLGFLVLTLAACEKFPQANNHLASCTPSFQKISEEPVTSNYGVWKFVFSVKLIGCEESLQTLTQAELQTIASEFREPSEWSNFLLYADSMKPEFRARATAKVNTLLGRKVATDVLVDCVTVIDYNPAPNGQ